MFQYLKVKLRECLYSMLLFLANHRYNGQTLLMYDAHEGNIERVKIICTVLSQTDKLAVINCVENNDNTALIYASRGGHTEIVQLLIQALQNANADIPLTLNHANISGRTALHHAAYHGHTEIVKLLIRAYQNANADIPLVLSHTDHIGQTALTTASLYGHTEIVQLLIQTLQNASAVTQLNHANNSGQTPLLYAADCGHTEIVQLLIQALRNANADIPLALNHADNTGHTALIYSAEHGHREIVKLLLLHGANLANGYSQEIAGLIALNNNSTLPQEKLLSIIQNDDISWVSTDFSHLCSKNLDEQNILRDLATWGVILGNQAFVTDMIPHRQDTLPLAERTEYLRLALQAQKFDVADIILESVYDNNPSLASNKQSMLNYSLYLMVVEHGPLSTIQFLLDRGAIPEEHSETQREQPTLNLLSNHTLFQEQNRNTLASDAIKVRQSLIANKQTLFHAASISGNHSALKAIYQSLASRTRLT